LFSLQKTSWNEHPPQPGLCLSAAYCFLLLERGKAPISEIGWQKQAESQQRTENLVLKQDEKLLAN